MAEPDHLQDPDDMQDPDDLRDESPTIDVETIDDDHLSLAEDTAEGDAPPEPTVEEQLAAEQDRVLRLQAELQNTLTRKSRELTEERKYAGLALMKDILPVLDNIDRAIEAAEGSESGDGSGLLEGFKLVRQQLVTVLTQHQCEAIEAVGEAFNPDFHEAILQQPSPDHEAGTVMMMTQTGYKLHDRVVRPAQVIVSSGVAE